MPAETSAAGGALIKWIGVPVVAASLAAALTFIFMPPATHREFIARLFVTFIGSFTLGPILYFGFMSYFPGILLLAVQELSGVAGLDAGMVKVSLSVPFLIAGGLPGWYVLGWAFRWMEKRKGKDLAEVAIEVADDIRRFRQ